MKIYLNDLKRNEPLSIVGQSGENFTMSVAAAFSVSSLPVVSMVICAYKAKQQLELSTSRQCLQFPPIGHGSLTEG